VLTPTWDKNEVKNPAVESRPGFFIQLHPMFGVEERINATEPIPCWLPLLRSTESSANKYLRAKLAYSL